MREDELIAPARYRADAIVLALVVALALALVFAPYVAGGKTLLSSAAEVPSVYATGARFAPATARLRSLDAAASGLQTEPWLAIEHRIVVDEHRLPFWDPYDGYGQPFDAAMQPQPFYPLTALLALHPAPATYTAWVLARLFIAGWFAALFVRLFADRYAAAAAGVAAALSGYYLLYYDIPHLSVDTALPMLLWATELVARRPSPARCGALAVAAALTYLGGMPETALLSMAVAALYAIVRLRQEAEDRLRRVAALAAGHAAGMLAGAIALVPFAAFVRDSFNVHEASKIGGTVAGTAYDGAWPRGLLTELAPLAFGYPWSSILTGGAGHSGVRGFFGCAVLLLAVIGVAGALARRGDRRTPVVAFLAAVALYCVLKRYGNPLAQWTGTLPLFSLVHYPKYVEYCLGDALAILAGFGVAALRERGVTTTAVAAAFAAALGALSYLYVRTRAEIPPGPLAWHYDAALAVALVALLFTGALAYVVVRTSGRWRRSASAALAVAVVAEVIAGYAGPQLWRTGPPASADPYAGAPYLGFLDAHVDRARERIFGVSGILFPNWPGAFGFADPRSLNALYPRDYLPFIDRFVTAHPPPSDDQFDRFTATRPLQLSAPLVRRWLMLSSVGWLLSPTPVESVEPPPGALLDVLWSQVGPTIPADRQPAVHTASVELDGVAEDVLFEHPPNEVRFLTPIPRARPVFGADVALQPASYAHAPVCGGAVTFTVSAEARGRTVATARRTIDPKHKASDRHWMPLRLDLSRWADRPVTLRLSTQARDACAAFAVWGEPRLSGRRAPARPGGRRLFALAFQAPGAYVYRVPDSLPRLMLYHRARAAATAPDALAMLGDASFDPRREAVVQQPAPVLAPPHGPERVVVTSQHSDELTADVVTTGDALLVQNDTWFPGWEATVDGRPAPVVRANFLFRGVALSSGRHTVRLAYRPRADTVGALLSALGALVVAALFAVPALKRRTGG